MSLVKPTVTTHRTKKNMTKIKTLISDHINAGKCVASIHNQCTGCTDWTIAGLKG